MIQIVKLVNGSEIVGDITKEDSNAITLSNPLSINYRYKNDLSPPIVSLTRFSPFTGDKEVIFKNEHVIARITPISSMISYYHTSLKNIIEHVDPSIDQELTAASTDPDEDLSPESQAKLALIERHVTKATLN